MGLTNQTETGIDVKQAVQAAKDYAETLFEPEEISGLGLEAVERPDRRYWHITLGFFRSPKPIRISPGLIARPKSAEREYKVFKVDAHTGNVLEMQMFKDK